MPKKGRKRGKMDTEGASGSGATNVDMDTVSNLSATKGSHSLYSEEGSDRLTEFDDADVAMEGDDRPAQDIFEDKLKEAIEGLLEKSQSGRINSIKSISSAFRKKVLTPFLVERHVTVADSLERSVKKGKGEEQKLATRALILLCIQLGLSTEGEQMFASIKSTLVNILRDPSSSPVAKEACAEALGVCGFIAASEAEEIHDIMTTLEGVFSKSYLKGDKTSASFSPQVYDVHCAALESWGLLLSISTPSAVKHHIDRQLHKLTDLLESPDLDMKIAGGETIALVYELARESNEDFEGPRITELCNRLKQLSTDNNKHQTKKGRKQQRSSFRDILRYIEDGTFKDFESKFGKESIYIGSWTRKRQYDAFCEQLESGTNTHLQENMLLREIFDLGAPLPTDLPQHKLSKNDRRLYNQAAFKARSQVRQKQRDKRMAQLSG